ncbi:hypothetical protein EV644_12488 [Kribbella orskensis]|uniref:Uncharacterized protein n=1 Tax=Kribbella orskensis TaxID=2512216 RepID=A0ABY2BAI3_9ACTN|nr:hypothetical protein EV642_12611 [Kribbella sp. VKM Ac-2500]TCO12964.1 hypothetical protein EV644_12488 [Kribbella orskensis]
MRRGLGKAPTTSVRRLISLFTRSNGLVNQISYQCDTGKSAKAVTSSASQHQLERPAMSLIQAASLSTACLNPP